MFVAAPRVVGGSPDSGFVAANLNSGPTLSLLPGHTAHGAALGADACLPSAVDFLRAGPHGRNGSPELCVGCLARAK